MSSTNKKWSTLMSVRLWNFFEVAPKKQDFWPKINIIQGKLVYFVNVHTTNDSESKRGKIRLSNWFDLYCIGQIYGGDFAKKLWPSQDIWSGCLTIFPLNAGWVYLTQPIQLFSRAWKIFANTYIIDLLKLNLKASKNKDYFFMFQYFHITRF